MANNPIISVTSADGQRVEIIPTMKGDAWRVRSWSVRSRREPGPNEGTMRYSLDQALEEAARLLTRDDPAVREAAAHFDSVKSAVHDRLRDDLKSRLERKEVGEAGVDYSGHRAPEIDTSDYVNNSECPNCGSKTGLVCPTCAMFGPHEMECHHGEDVCEWAYATQGETAKLDCHALRASISDDLNPLMPCSVHEPDVCEYGFTDAAECSTSRERSVAGKSNDVPSCDVHGVFVDDSDAEWNEPLADADLEVLRLALFETPEHQKLATLNLLVTYAKTKAIQEWAIAEANVIDDQVRRRVAIFLAD